MSINKSYQKAAANLKKLGLIDYDLRYRLSSSQKGQITKLKKEYGHVIKHPEKFHIAKVGKDTAKALRDSGFKVTPTNKALIPLHDYTSAHISKNAITFSSGRLTEKTYLAGSKDFHRKLLGLMETKLPRNSLITARIGDNMPFKRSRFGKYADLYHYVHNVFEPKDPGTDKQRLVMQMSVVTIHENRGFREEFETVYVNGKRMRIPLKKAAKKNGKKKGTK